MTHLSVFDSDDMRRVCTRIAHEIIEKNHGASQIILVGLLRRGALLAKRLSDQIANIEGVKVPAYSLDITSARDDLTHADPTKVDSDNDVYPESINKAVGIDLSKTKVVIVDDVLFTGRSVRAAMDVISGISRPSGVQLAVLIDRGHRELPIRADFVGKNLGTKKDGESVLVLMEEIDEVDRVDIMQVERP